MKYHITIHERKANTIYWGYFVEYYVFNFDSHSEAIEEAKKIANGRPFKLEQE